MSKDITNGCGIHDAEIIIKRKKPLVKSLIMERVQAKAILATSMQ